MFFQAAYKTVLQKK